MKRKAEAKADLTERDRTLLNKPTVQPETKPVDQQDNDVFKQQEAPARQWTYDALIAEERCTVCKRKIGTPPTPRHTARCFILAELATGPKSRREICAKAKQQRIPETSIDRAKRDLGNAVRLNGAKRNGLWE
jgi:hypothetical protein